MNLLQKIVRCFGLAHTVTHHYWAHLDGDDGKVSIENVQHIVERITGLKVEKFLVPFDGDKIRGNCERYPDRAVIHIRKNQSLEWQRYTVMKELSHLLMDDEEDCSTDVMATIKDLVEYQSLDIDDGVSAALKSERLAEILALELLYPLELRFKDRDRVNAGTATPANIAAERGVPLLWVNRCFKDEHLSTCKSVWGTVSTAEVKPLPETGEKAVRSAKVKAEV